MRLLIALAAPVFAACSSSDTDRLPGEVSPDTGRDVVVDTTSVVDTTPAVDVADTGCRVDVAPTCPAECSEHEPAERPNLARHCVERAGELCGWTQGCTDKTIGCAARVSDGAVFFFSGACNGMPGFRSCTDEELAPLGLDWPPCSDAGGD